MRARANRLLVAKAELGERIMRALILRRVGLLETGAEGPVIVGRAENGEVLRRQGFLRRNGHPHRRLEPETDPEAKALVERFHVDPGQLPIVLCPRGQLLRNRGETELARCIGLFGYETGGLGDVFDFIEWARQDSNLQPSGYEPLALTIELRALKAVLRRFFQKVEGRIQWFRQTGGSATRCQPKPCGTGRRCFANLDDSAMLGTSVRG